MVLKRILSTILIILSVIFIVVLPCFAHPGRTDGNGGHYDYDTGEYHYHNDGSPQNTPQYGSGNFSSDEDDTETTKSFAEWSKEKNKYSDSESDYKSDYNYSSNTEEEENEETAKGSNGGYIAYIVISIIAFIILISAVLVYRSDSKDYKRLSNQLKSEISELNTKQKLLEDKNNKAEEEIKFLQNKLKAEKKYEGETVAELIGIPTDSIIGEDNLPREENATQYWGEKYTFFVSWKGDKYHKQSCRHAKTAIPINAYSLRTRDCHPCYSCNPILPDMKWVDRHFEIKAFKEKHGIVDNNLTDKSEYENDPNIKINYRNK